MTRKKYNRLSFKDAQNKYTYFEIYDYYINKLHSFKECQEKFNVSQKTFTELLNYHHIVKDQELIKKTNTRNSLFNSWSNELKDSFEYDYLYSNLTYSDILSKYKLSNYRMIRTIAKKLNLSCRLNKKHSKTLNELIIEFNSNYDYNLNLLMSNTLDDCAILFDTTKYYINKLIDILGITNERNTYVRQLNVIRAKKTKFEKYGDENYHNIEKMKETNLARYGKRAFVNMEKTAQTKFERYGDLNYNNREKVVETCLKKYGVKHYTNPDKRKQTNLKRYGFENPAESNIVKAKISRSQMEAGNLKGYLTKKKNNTLNSSKIEKYFLNEIKPLYKDDLIYQYKQDSRYPFNCDFYIKSLDLFIELNLYWTHGGHRFDPNNEDDLKQLEIWKEKAKNSNFYYGAIKNWSERDILKFNTAEKNNLNYKVLYDENSVYSFIEELINFKDGRITQEG